MPKPTAAANATTMPETTLTEIRSLILLACDEVEGNAPELEDAIDCLTRALSKVDTLLKGGRK